jgi:hypothetical protein
MKTYVVWLNEDGIVTQVRITADSVGRMKDEGGVVGAIQFFRAGEIVAEVDTFDGWAIADSYFRIEES